MHNFFKNYLPYVLLLIGLYGCGGKGGGQNDNSSPINKAGANGLPICESQLVNDYFSITNVYRKYFTSKKKVNYFDTGTKEKIEENFEYYEDYFTNYNNLKKDIEKFQDKNKSIKCDRFVYVNDVIDVDNDQNLLETYQVAINKLQGYSLDYSFYKYKIELEKKSGFIFISIMEDVNGFLVLFNQQHLLDYAQKNRALSVETFLEELKTYYDKIDEIVIISEEKNELTDIKIKQEKIYLDYFGKVFSILIGSNIISNGDSLHTAFIKLTTYSAAGGHSDWKNDRDYFHAKNEEQKTKSKINLCAKWLNINPDEIDHKKEADRQRLKKAVRKVQLELHPDKHPDEKDKHELEFKEFMQAVDTFRDLHGIDTNWELNAK